MRVCDNFWRFHQHLLWWAVAMTDGHLGDPASKAPQSGRLPQPPAPTKRTSISMWICRVGDLLSMYRAKL